jgi:hypothetical protein
MLKSVEPRTVDGMMARKSINFVFDEILGGGDSSDE